MTPILIAILCAFTVCAYFYVRIVVKERSRHLQAERDAERDHARDWKTLAIDLTERGLLFREMPLLREDMAMLTKPVEAEPLLGDRTLEELEDEYEQIANPLNVSSQGELGRRRELAKAIALKRRDSDLREKSELLDEDIVSDFGPADIRHLEAH